jgi:lipopolysaccharide transport system permease protein
MAQTKRLIELFFTLFLKDLKIRYRGTALGFLWCILNPLLQMLVYILIFSVYVRNPIKGYPAFVFSALLPWMWFSYAICDASNTYLNNAPLLKKIPLPLAIFPTLSVTTSFVHFLFSLPLLLCIILFFKKNFSPSFACMPLLLFAQFLFTLGLCFPLSCVCVWMQDFVQAIPTLLTLVFFLTPILYSYELAPATLKEVLNFNPLALFATAYQDVLFWQRFLSPSLIASIIFMSLISFFLGVTLFSFLKNKVVESL